MTRLLVLCCLGITLQAQEKLTNLSFDEGDLGQSPKGWLSPTAKTGYRAVTTDECGRPGSRCAVLRYEGQLPASGFGLLGQYVDATAYREKRIRFRALVRADPILGGRAQLLFRVDRPAEQIGFLDNMQDRPVTASQWNAYEITGSIHGDAERVFVGMMLVGAGAACIDEASFEVLGDVPLSPATIEPARPLSPRGLENLTAFARLFGHLRYFHPSTEGRRVDWETLAISGVRAVEDAEDAASLAKRLGDFFSPFAPAVRIFPTSQSPPRTDPGTGTRMMFWVHRGVGTGDPSTRGKYSSRRAVTTVGDNGLPPPLLEDIGAGVKALIPTALYVDDAGRTVPQGQTRPPEFPMLRYSGNDRGTRLADVILTWNVFQHFYPYFDVTPANWRETLATALQSVASDRDEKAFLLTLRRLVAAARDGHGFVHLPPPQYAVSIVWDWIEGRLVITHVVNAQDQTIERGDAVIAVNGRPAEQALREIEASTSAATPQRLRFWGLLYLSLGPREEPLLLQVESHRQPAKRSAVKLVRGGGVQDDPRPEKIAELKPGIIYVDLTRIENRDWEEVLPRLNNAAGIILDMRGGPRVPHSVLGYLSETPITGPQWHLPVVSEPGQRNMKFERQQDWEIPPLKPFLRSKKMFLTDARTMSSGESFMQIVEHYRLGEIVGQPTAGTNGDANSFKLPGGYQVWFTGLKVLKHDGAQLHGVGIKPTVAVSRTRAGVIAGKDETLERAVAMFP